jgi:ketosteroid isomerase-like protein
MIDRLVRDELAIRSLAAAYTDAVNRRDGTGMAAVYAPDGELSVPTAGAPVVGIAALAKRFRKLVEVDREFLFQMTHSGVVEISGDTAQARWWFSELKKPAGQPYEYILGVYQDDVVRLDSGWRFARRTVSAPLRWELPAEGIAHQALPPFLAITGLPHG